MFTVNQFAIFREILHDLEERSWALEEGMPVVEYDNFVGPWRVIVDVFANSQYTQILFQRKGQLVALNKGISFPLGLFQSFFRKINILLTFENVVFRRWRLSSRVTRRFAYPWEVAKYVGHSTNTGTILMAQASFLVYPFEHFIELFIEFE